MAAGRSNPNEASETTNAYPNRASLAPLTVRIPDAVQILRISRTRIYELITSGDIEVIKLGRSTLVVAASLYALVERLRQEQAGGSVASR